MTARDFYDRVAGHGLLRWIGVLPGTMEVAVLLAGGPPGRARAIPLADVARRGWCELEAVLTGARRGRVLLVMSRVVGYFSWEHNWNGSKTAEAVDRRAGMYDVSDLSALTPEAPHPEVVRELMVTGAEAACELGKKGAEA